MQGVGLDTQDSRGCQVAATWGRGGGEQSPHLVSPDWGLSGMTAAFGRGRVPTETSQEAEACWNLSVAVAIPEYHSHLTLLAEQGG